LETTEVDRYQDEEKRKREMDLGAVSFWLKGRGRRSHEKVISGHEEVGDVGSWNDRGHGTSSYARDDSCQLGNHVISLSIDFAARHEMLLNALFEDAMHRHEQRVLLEGGGGGAVVVKGDTSRAMMTPPRPSRKSSIGTAGDTPGGATSISGYSKSSLSKSSTCSFLSTGSFPIIIGLIKSFYI
jgi:hypothetical protein